MGSYCHADSAEAAPSQKGDTSGTDCVETAILQRFAIDISYLSRYICQKYLSEKNPRDKTSQKTFSHHPMNRNLLYLPKHKGKFNKAKSNRTGAGAGVLRSKVISDSDSENMGDLGGEGEERRQRSASKKEAQNMP